MNFLLIFQQQGPLHEGQENSMKLIYFPILHPARFCRSCARSGGGCSLMVVLLVGIHMFCVAIWRLGGFQRACFRVLGMRCAQAGEESFLRGFMGRPGGSADRGHPRFGRLWTLARPDQHAPNIAREEFFANILYPPFCHNVLAFHQT